MKRLVGAVAGGVLVVASAWAQPTRVWTAPAVPAPELLDRFNLRLGWRIGIPVDGYKDGIATVQNLGDVIVVQNRSGAITAVDPVTGEPRWRKTVGQPYPITQAVGHNDTLLLISNGTRIYAIDRATGGSLWDVNLPGSPSSAPTANSDAFYICLNNGRLSAYAFPGESGSTSTTPQPRLGFANAPRTPAVPGRRTGGTATTGVNPAAAPGGGGGRSATVGASVGSRSATNAVQVSGGRTAITGSEVNRVGRQAAILNAPRLLWDYQTNLRIAERPILGEKHLLVVGTGRDALFIDKSGGQPVEFVADAPFSSPAGRYGEVAYAACVDGSVYAFHLPTRLPLWQATVNGSVVQRPVATDEDLFVVSERGGLNRLARANGEALWQNSAAVKFVASNPKFVYARDGVGRLLILDRARGTTLASVDLSDFTFDLANGESDRLILGAANGLLINLHDRAYPQPLHLRNPAPIAVTPGTSDDGKPESPVEPPPKSTPKPKTPPVPPKPPAQPPAKPPTPPKT